MGSCWVQDMANSSGKRGHSASSLVTGIIPNVPVVDPGPLTPGLVKSAGRALEIFDFFDEVKREAQEQEIARRLKYPQSSTSMLLKCLVQLGYLDFEPKTRTFFPSPRIALLGAWPDNGPVRDGRLIHMMEELANETRETVILAARNGIYAHYIRVVQTRASTAFFVPQGSRRLAVWSATGFALLAQENDDAVRALCLRTNAEAPSGQPIVQLKTTRAHIQQTRRNGYFFSKALVTEGAGAIAMPLPKGIDRRNRPLAIGISGPLEDFAGRERRIVRQLRITMDKYLGTWTGR